MLAVARFCMMRLICLLLLQFICSLVYRTPIPLQPIYFASSGLKTQFGLIDDGASVGLALLVVLVATVTKIIGIMIPCWWLKFPCRMNGEAARCSCRNLLLKTR